REPLASHIFLLTRVTRIFEKSVFTKFAPTGPRCCEPFVARTRGADERRRKIPQASRAASNQPGAVGNLRQSDSIVSGLFFTMHSATATWAFRRNRSSGTSRSARPCRRKGPAGNQGRARTAR